MSSIESMTAQLRQAREEIDSLKVDNARLRGALQEAIALAEQLGRVSQGNSYYTVEALAPLKALAQTVIELGTSIDKAPE